MTGGERNEGPRIQRADTEARSKAIRLAVIGIAGAALLAALLTALEHDITAWIERHVVDLVDTPGTLTLLLGIVMLPLLAMSVYVFREGSRIVRARRFPPPGQQVIKDTPIIEGNQAVRRGRAIQLIALLMAAISLAMPLLPQWLITQINQ